LNALVALDTLPCVMSMGPIRPNAKLALARVLRREATVAERRLWEELRARRLEGHKFVRQAPIGPFIADFLCREAKLVVEVDGPNHEGAEAYDARRTAFLVREGYRIVRIRNDEVTDGMAGALAAIQAALG
jgi:very-short-patch-repair endonuclease